MEPGTSYLYWSDVSDCRKRFTQTCLLNRVLIIWTTKDSLTIAANALHTHCIHKRKLIHGFLALLSHKWIGRPRRLISWTELMILQNDLTQQFVQDRLCNRSDSSFSCPTVCKVCLAQTLWALFVIHCNWTGRRPQKALLVLMLKRLFLSVGWGECPEYLWNWPMNALRQPLMSVF